VGSCGLDSSGSGQASVVGSCDQCNESSSVKGGTFSDHLCDYPLSNMESAVKAQGLYLFTFYRGVC
jgi:hypothetical protein